MTEELETVLRLVANGTLTPDQASPIVEALIGAERRVGRGHARIDPEPERVEDPGGGRSRRLRIRVTERGRQVVNLRIPIGFVDAALSFVPGIGGDQSERIRQAVEAGEVGPIIDVEDPSGDGVLISVE